MLRKLLIGIGTFLKRTDYYVLTGTFLTLLGVVLPLIPSKNLYTFFAFEDTWGLVSYIGIILTIFIVVVIGSQILGILTIYWGRSIAINANILPYIQTNSHPQHISLKIENHEKEDLIDCRASMTLAEQVVDHSTDILSYINPNDLLMSWGGGSKTEYVTIPGDDGSKVLNIAYVDPKDGELVFLFFGWESHPLKANLNYHISIKIDGKLDDERFKPLKYDGCIRLNKYNRDLDGARVTAFEFVNCEEAVL